MRAAGLNKIFLFAVLLVLTVVSIGFGAEDTAMVNLSYRLKWLFNVSVAGDLNADVSGAFGSQGLKVKVKSGGPERDAIKELELGRAQFGVASADQIIRAMSKGAGLVVIAQLFQANPLHWIYRPAVVRIEQPQDLKAKIVGITYGGIDENIMRALLARYNIGEKELTLFSVRYDFTPFYRGKVHLWPIYRNAQGPIIQKKLLASGEKVDFFDPAAFGIHSVANSVITSKKMMEQHADIVERFLRGLLKGWEAAMDPANTEMTVALVHRFDRDTPEDIIRQQLDLTRRFIKPDAKVKIGTIDMAAWKQTEKMMLDQGLIPKPVAVAHAIAALVPHK